MPARRKSNQAKHIRGTTRADRQPRKDFAERLPRAPPPPPGMSSEAALQWRWLARATVSVGTLTRADTKALELLSNVLATEAQARALLTREGLTIMAGSGGRKSHPAAKVAEAARAQATRLLEHFGLTPKSRQSVELPPSRADDPAARFFS